MPSFVASLCALWVVGVAWVAPARAEPWVQVRARTMFDGLVARAEGQDVLVEGTLRDNLGAPVADSPVVVAADGARVEARSGAEGRFSARLALSGSGEREVVVGFAGGGLLAGTRAALPVTIGRNAVNLRIDAPDEVDAGVAVPIGVVASDGRAVPVGGLRVQLWLDGQPWQQGTTDARGRVTVAVPALVPGMHRVGARFAGSRQWLPAEVERGIEAARPLAVMLAAAGAPGAGDPVVLDARLGAERPGSVRVTLTAEGRPVAERMVSGDRVRFDVDPGDVEPGPVRFRALVHSAAPGWRDAISETVTVEVPPPPPPSPWWVRAPVILAGLSLVGALWRVRRRPRAAALARVEAPVAAAPFVFEEGAGVEGGALWVVVRDALDGRPLPAVLVRLGAGAAEPDPGAAAPPEGERVVADAAGRARLAVDAAGDRLWAHAPGYAAACHPLPRRGGRAVIHLLPLRARLQGLYAELLADAGRPPLRFGRQTPREAGPPLVARGAPGDALDELTWLVERACFGPRAPVAADLAEALRLAAVVRGSLGRGSAGRRAAT
ncbi:MAG: hypothetical protein H6705_10595 [Myxococcales bacterium]|nr:hypothetical protein [Myxococcales bacterium]